MSILSPKMLMSIALVLGLVFVGLLALGYLLRGPVVLSPAEPFRPPAVSADRLRERVEVLCGDLHPRSYAPPERLGRVADWIAGQLRNGVPDLRIEQPVYAIAEGEYRNVVATRSGTDAARGAVVIGAHYDAWGGMPGADDNASGVAVLLELIATLPPQPPARTQIFAFFANEEPPFFTTEDMGSHHLVRALVEDGVDVELMLALDLVGFYSDERGSQRFPTSLLRLYYPAVGDFIAVVSDTGAGGAIRQTKRGLRSAGTIPVLSMRAPTVVPGVDWSDHYWFRKLGMPAVLITDTAFLRTPHYHLPSDTPDTLDYERMAGLVQALHGVLADE